MEAVLYYVLWMVALTLLYVGHRIPLALLGKQRADHWTRGQPNSDNGFQIRASHAHANTVENFPVFAAVVCIAALMQKSATVDAVACYILYARLAQSVVHLIGTSFILVSLRATFFVVQLALIVYVVYQLLCCPVVAAAAG
jgi:uncharacterized MAPEG superfamily protein